jgi:hypothetical protein
MFAYSPNSPLSNLWSIKDLLPDDPGADSIRECWDAARKNLRLAHDNVRRKYDRHRRPPLQVGARVWLRNFHTIKAGRHISAKLSPRYKGPCLIAEFSTPVSVRLTDVAGETRVRAHVSQLKGAWVPFPPKLSLWSCVIICLTLFIFLVLFTNLCFVWLVLILLCKGKGTFDYFVMFWVCILWIYVIYILIYSIWCLFN